METDKELDILEHIYNNQDAVRQRESAHIAGVSLGMINVLIKRFTEKGWIKIKKVNNRNIQYIVSPKGIDAISHRSYNFLKRTIKNMVYYKDELENLILKIKHMGYTAVALVGPSQVDFLVEHFCQKYGLNYLVLSDAEEAEDAGKKAYRLFCEDTDRAANDVNVTMEKGAFLKEVLIG